MKRITKWVGEGLIIGCAVLWGHAHQPPAAPVSGVSSSVTPAPVPVIRTGP